MLNFKFYTVKSWLPSGKIIDIWLYQEFFTQNAFTELKRKGKLHSFDELEKFYNVIVDDIDKINQLLNYEDVKGII